MRFSHTQRQSSPRSHRRSGLLAASEMTYVAVALCALSWVASQAETFSNDDQNELASVTRACSDRPVYRISLAEPEHRLWVFRFPVEVTGLNLATGHIDKSCSSQGAYYLTTVAHSRDGTTSLMVSHDKLAQLGRQDHDTVWLQIPSESPSVVNATISAAGSVSLIGLADGTVYGWNASKAGVETFNYQLPQKRRLTQMCLSGDGERLFVAHDDGSASIHRALTGELMRESLIPKSECTAATWSEDGRNVAIATADGSIRLVDAQTGRQVWRNKPNLPPHQLSRICCLAVSEDGRWLAAGGLSTTCVVWDVTSADAAYRLSGHDGLIRAVTFSPRTSTLFTGSLDGSVREWSLESFTALKKFE